MEKTVHDFPDEELCALAAGGDDDAMAELIKRIMPLAVAKAAMYECEDVHSDDLVQEGMLGFITAVSTYNREKGASFKTYAGVCINNRIISSLRKTQSKKNIPPEMVSSIDEENSDVQDFSSDPQEIFSSREDMLFLRNVIDEKLSKLEKEVLALRLHGLSYDAISKKMDISTKSVDNALGRVRRKLNEEK